MELIEPLGPVDARKLLVTQIFELVLGVELIARSCGEQDLAAAARLADARGAVRVQAEVRAVAGVRLAGVHAPPHAEVGVPRSVALGEGSPPCDVGVCPRAPVG